MRFWFEYRAQRLELRPGTFLVGRSPTCHVVLDDGLVSRRHARILITPDRVVIEDLGSANGVYVNEHRVIGRQPLLPGDRVVMGQQSLVLRESEDEAEPPSRVAADTLHGTNPALGATTAPPPNGELDIPVELADATESSDERTRRGHAIDLLGGVADKVLALGRGDEAERILSTALTTVLETAANSGLETAMAQRAASYAVKLADATGKGQWVDYAIDLYGHLGRPLPQEIVDRLYTVLRRVQNVNLAGLRSYVESLRAMQDGFGPAERFVFQRIEGLVKLAALR